MKLRRQKYCLNTLMAGALASILVNGPAFAQTTADPATPDSTAQPAESNIVYLPADFARFAPRTALDMVRQIPDFTLTDTDDDRGLGQASQNVLVNGQRVAGKSNDAETTLERISATAVERIEILDGARLGIPGLTGRVANVIVRNSSIAVQFRWEGQQRRYVPDQITNGAISASGRLGATDFTLSLSNNNALRRGGIGNEIVTDAAGLVTLTRDQSDEFRADLPRLAGSLSRVWDDGRTLNLNASGEYYIYRASFDALATPTDNSGARRELFLQRENEWGFEFGGDYEMPLGAGRLKLIGLQTYENNPSTDTFTITPAAVGSATTGSRFQYREKEGESVIRVEYSWTAGGDWQLAAEGAYNFLDTRSTIGSLGSNGLYDLQPFPGGDTFVDEWRGELILSHGWTLAQGVSLQTNIGGEYSRLRQTSVGGTSRQFFRPKGSAALAWAVNPRLTINASLSRNVGQLSFSDFSAAIDLQNNAAIAGNADLVPEQSWRFDVEAVRSFGAAGSITIGGYGEYITDIVDRIPLSATEEGIGNLPSARRWGATARGTLLLDSFGLRGVRVNFNGELARSSVRDPVTGLHRRISRDPVRNWSVDLRHDIAGSDIAWGASAGEERNGAIFRLDQSFDNSLTRPFSGVFVEHKDLLGLTVRLSIRNLLGIREDIRRDVYVDRRDGPIDFRERQLRRIGLIGVLVISGSF